MLTFISKYRHTHNCTLLPEEISGKKRERLNKWGRAGSSPFLIMTTLTCSSPHLGQGDHSPSRPALHPPPSTSQRWPDKASLSAQNTLTLPLCVPALSLSFPLQPSPPCGPAQKLIQVAFLTENFLTLAPANHTPPRCTGGEKTRTCKDSVTHTQKHRNAHRLYTDKGW